PGPRRHPRRGRAGPPRHVLPRPDGPVTFLIRQGRHYPRAWDLLRAVFAAGFHGPLSGVVTATPGMLAAVQWPDAPCHGDASKIIGRTFSPLTLNPRRGSERVVWRPHPRHEGGVQFGYMFEDAAGLDFDWQPEPYDVGEPFHYGTTHTGWGWPCVPYVGGQCPARADCPVTIHADGFVRRLLTALAVLALLVTLAVVLL